MGTHKQDCVLKTDSRVAVYAWIPSIDVVVQSAAACQVRGYRWGFYKRRYSEFSSQVNT